MPGCTMHPSLWQSFLRCVRQVAQHDSSEYVRQAEEFAHSLRELGQPVTQLSCLEASACRDSGELMCCTADLLRVWQVDHFSIIQQLTNPNFLLTHELVALIRGSC